MTPIAYVIRLFLFLYSRQAFLTEVVSFYKQPAAALVLYEPIEAKLWPISERRENWNSLSDCYLHIGKYHLAHHRPNTRFYGACRTYTNFFCLILILHRFRIIDARGALHSALFNYTPLVIRGTSKNKHNTKLALTAINKLFAL
jgi:hypothetical protein